MRRRASSAEEAEREERLIDAVQEGLDDLDAGRVVSDGELGRRLDACFGLLAEPAEKK